jgi:hypothetical protein
MSDSLSILALVISCITLYLTFFRRKPALVGMLLLRHFEVKGKYDSELEYSLGNTGNQQLLLKKVELRMQPSVEKKVDYSYRLPKVECTDAPSIMEPGHIKLIKVRMGEKTIGEARSENEKCFVCFTILSPRGKSYEVLHDIAALSSNDKEAEKAVWRPFGLGKPCRH